MSAQEPARTPYRQSGTVVATQRCAYGDDVRGYCGAPAVEHVAVTQDPGRDDGSHTMTCAEHVTLIDHEIRDRHPVTGPCGLPGATWLYSHPTGGPGWCEVDGIDWLSAADAATPAAAPGGAQVRT